MSFDQMGLIKPLAQAISEQGYDTPTPIQEKAFPFVINGRDIIGCAQTGTGKTAAFALPIIQRLCETQSDAPKPKNKSSKYKRRPIRSLILSPTRELAAQIEDSFKTYGQYTHLNYTVVYGGVKQHAQCRALQKGVDILIATPGRLLDLLNQGIMSLDQVEIFVLDEADRMLDMGFIVDIRKIIKMIPEKRQTLMFSATMPKEIQALADSILTKPASVKVKAENVAADTVEQYLYYVSVKNKTELLCDILRDPEHQRVMVFSRTKRGADRIVKQLAQEGLPAEAIHSDKTQGARQRALNNFKSGRTKILVASDIAARGLDVDQISLVINYDLPDEAENYVHRIGRTGRAGESGFAISFCSGDQENKLRRIQRILGKNIPVLDHPLCMREGAKAKANAVKKAHPLDSIAPKKGRNQKSRKPRRANEENSQFTAGAAKKPKRKRKPNAGGVDTTSESPKARKETGSHFQDRKKSKKTKFKSASRGEWNPEGSSGGGGAPKKKFKSKKTKVKSASRGEWNSEGSGGGGGAPKKSKSFKKKASGYPKAQGGKSKSQGGSKSNNRRPR